MYCALLDQDNTPPPTLRITNDKGHMVKDGFASLVVGLRTANTPL